LSSDVAYDHFDPENELDIYEKFAGRS
jgi:hypothetical protein